ncbi:hypothetical protein ACPFL9_16160 [Paenarthrobacter sp. NyZ202]|uniref:hypothetical protein n=1 Tax=Paenarthrobacter sp. NyZ202 TaxID=3402689 RepID=UPI003CEAEA74
MAQCIQPSSSHTALGFEVHDIEQLVAEMKARGVAFQDYYLPDLKTQKPHLYNRSRKVRLVHGQREQHPLHP